MKFILFFCSVLILNVVYLDAIKFRCDYTYIGLAWYKYYEVPATWKDARFRCHLQGAILASPTTSAIKATMVRAIGKTAIFTGFHATYTSGNYYSIDGIPLESVPREWANSEPDNKLDAERCLALDSDGKLSDKKCDEPRPYICFRENNHVDVNICGTPDSEYHYESRTNACYKLHTKPRNFKRAAFACSAEGGHLAIVNSEEESKVIKDLFARYPGGKMLGNFWKDVAFIGFHNWGESTDWTTLHGQSIQEAGFDKFSGGEPNNSTEGEYCGSIYRNGLLNDLWCEKHYAFICEKKPDYPPVCDTESFNESHTLAIIPPPGHYD